MTDHAISNAADWLETIRDQLQRLKDACQSKEQSAYETIREEILESPLAVDVRSGWHSVGAQAEPEEFQILLTTGGPALRIVGDLGQFNCPERSRMEWQDWGTSWTEYGPADSATLDAWVAQFWFGD